MAFRVFPLLYLEFFKKKRWKNKKLLFETPYLPFLRPQILRYSSLRLHVAASAGLASRSIFANSTEAWEDMYSQIGCALALINIISATRSATICQYSNKRWLKPSVKRVNTSKVRKMCSRTDLGHNPLLHSTLQVVSRCELWIDHLGP